jgi:uncharacterized protein (TIGR02001 family)
MHPALGLLASRSTAQRGIKTKRRPVPQVGTIAFNLDKGNPMRKSILGLSALALLASATPAFAEEEAAGPITVSGSVGLVSDYRFRGFSQTRQNPAVQGGITVTHESGFYVGTWGSNVDFPDLDGAGNGATAEIDLFAGYGTELAPGISIDVGLLYYLYPKDTVTKVSTDFFEPYVTLIGELGPVTLKVGANYAWEQDALGSSDAFYLRADPSLAVPGTPLSVTGHLGYATSDAFPGGVDGEVFDWSLGVSASWQSLTFGVSYVDTDEPGQIRGSDAAVVFSLSAAF